MNYKFLNGARRAGVTLALILLGAIGVLAQTPVTVTVNLGDIKFANGTTKGTTTQATNPLVSVGSTLATANSDDVFAEWKDPAAGSTKKVSAVFKWHPAAAASGGNAAVAAGYGDTLYILHTALTASDTIKITGQLATSVKVSQIDFSASPTVVNWDGGRIVGNNTAKARTNSEFLYLGTGSTPSSATKRIAILSGSIESWAVSILKDIKTPTRGGLVSGTSLPAPIGNMVGAIGSAAAGSREITLISHGKGAALVGEGAFAINSPGSGKYTITADSAAVKSNDPAAEVQIGSELAGVGGVLTINAWTTASTAAAAATGSSAIEAAAVYVKGAGNSGASKNIVINSKSKSVIASSGSIEVVEAQIDHTAPAGTVGATAFSSAGGNVTLEKVIVNGVGTGNLAGRVVEAGGSITIKGGKFAPAGDSKGVAVSTDQAVLIEGAKITSAGTAATAGGYVVAGSSVTIKSSSSDSAVVAWAGTGAAVGGVYATQNVSITTDNLYKVEVRVNGAGVGVDVWPQSVPTTVSGTVTVGGNAGNSAFITVATGQALVVSNTASGALPWGVILDNAVIRRSGTGSTTALVDVTGADVAIDGVSLTRTNLVAGSNVAVVARNNGPTGSYLGGFVSISGGSISGVTGGVTGDYIVITRGVDAREGDKNIKIETTTGVAVKAVGGADYVGQRGDVEINNGNAVILNNAGLASTSEVPSAAVFSLHQGITIVNVDSIRAGGQAVALLTLKPKDEPNKVYGGTVSVFSGKIRSASAFGINAASDITVDKVDPVLVSVCDSIQWTPVGGSTKLSRGIGAKRGDVVISTSASNANFSAVYSDGGKVWIGKAEIAATAAGGASAVYTLRGEVTVDDEEALVTSASGTGIYVRNEGVKVNGGNVVSNPATGNFAAIWVVDGDVNVGQALPSSWAKKREEVKKWTNITSNGSLAIFADGAGEYKVNVGRYAKLNVKGSAATAGGVRVLKNIEVNFNGQYTASGDNSKAFAIEAAVGDVNIGGKAGATGEVDTLATIKSDGGVAVTTVGGNINVGSYTSITGNSGRLLYAKDTTNRKAGTVTIGGAASVAYTPLARAINVYNKNGAAIKAVEKVYIYGLTGDPTMDNAPAANRVVVGTDTDTAITTGKVTTAETISGEVWVRGGRVWAAGNYNTSTPIAIASKKVYQEGGVIEANTEKTAVDNEEVYTTASATGISIRDKAGTGELKITGGKIIAHGKSVGIRNSDTSVTVYISPAIGAARSWSIGNGHVSDKGRAAVSIAAGNNGTAIWSKGAITVLGNDTIQPTDKSADGKLNVHVYIGSGNKTNARVIHMPVDDGTKRKDLWLERAFVEAGSDGAIAIEGGKNTLTRVDHSVVLVRHASTAVKGLGGVFVYSGYVEVLATEDDKSGTAITGNEIRIDGGRLDEQDKSEVHSKGIAVYDLRSAAEGKTVVQITSVVHLSGSIKTDLDVGSSVLGDTAFLTMGSVNSSRLYELSTLNVNETVRDTYDTLFIPKGITVNVADNGSRFETEENDVVIDSGVVSTVGKQAGAKFINNGKVVIVKDGNVSFNKADNESFYNSGVLVLKTGSKLDNKVLVHDTGAYISTLNASGDEYTFLRWARVLGDGDRGDGQVIVPPLFASLYDNTNNRFTENTDWDVFSSRTDSVYTVVEDVKYPIDERYKPYIDGVDDQPLSGTNVEWIDEDGESAFLTAAGTFTRTAKAKNEAGEAEKTFTHKVLKVPLLKIDEWQDPSSSEYYFDGYVLSEAGDTILIRDAGYEPLYSGKADGHVVNIKGALSSVTVWPDDKEVYYGGTNGWGIGVPTVWYESTNESSSYYQLSSRVPVNVGTYNVYASFAEGRDFVAVPTNDAVFIGTFEIREGTVASVFGTKTTESSRVVSLLAGKDTTVRVPLPKVSVYEAKYFGDLADLEGELDGDLEGYVTGSARLVGGDTLVFGVNRLSEIGQSMTFQVGIDPSYARNFQDGQYITVRVNFLSVANMVEAKPDYVSVDYKNDLLIGFNRGSVYSINGVVTTFTTTSSYPIDKEWEGDTVRIVALPGPDSYKSKSDTALIVVAARLGVTAVLDSVKADPTSTTSASDGRLTGTTVAMEYKLVTDSVWKQAGNVVTGGLKAGTYTVRIAATEYSFASESVTRTIGTLVSVADANREIPTANGATEAAVAPVKIKASAFTAGPSPVSKNGTIKFFSTKQVKTGTLYIFDATGKSVGKVRAKSGTGEIGSWNVGNKAEGLYVIKGALVGKDGTKEKVSFVFSVVK